jgi:hypothetical protein
MPLEKVLQKIKFEIKELGPTLELFLDDTIQPSADDCQRIQNQLHSLLENIAVFKYNKLDKEISPSFKIHAKVSQQENPETTANEFVEHEKKVEVLVEEKINITEIKAILFEPPHQKFTNLVINLNDKFRFINELFGQNNSEYHIALEQLNNLNTWSDTEVYLNSLKSLYEWDAKDEVVKYFYGIAKKRFD